MIITPTSWCERNIRLSHGMWDRWEFPGMVGPMEYLHQNKGSTVILMGAAQGFKTLMATCYTLYRMATRNHDAGWYANVESTMIDIYQQKFQPLYEPCTGLHQVCIRDLKDTKRLANGQLKFYSANRDGDRQQKSLRYVNMDEAHLYGSAQIPEILNRMTGFAGYQECLITSTGAEKTTDFTDMCDSATQFVWSPPCDACGLPMDYSFFGSFKLPFTEDLTGERITDEDGKEWIRPFGGLQFARGEEIFTESGYLIEEKLAESLYYECPHCGHRHTWDNRSRDERNRMALRGWRKQSGSWYGYQCTEKRSSSIALFHYSGLYHMDWLELAKEWITADRARKRGDHLMVAAFYKTRIGKNYSKHFDLKARQNKQANQGEYQQLDPTKPQDLKEWWPDMDFAIGTVDVGKDHFWVVFRAWNTKRGQLQSRLIWAGLVLSRNTLRDMQINLGIADYGGWENLLVNNRTNHVIIGGNGCGVFIDGNYDKLNAVRRLAAEYSWVVYRGRDERNRSINRDYRHKDGAQRIYSDIELVEHWDEETQTTPTAQIYFASVRCENILWDMRNILEPEPIWTFGTNVTQEYLKHMEARSLTESGEWVQNHETDHLWDCEKMQIGVLATMGLIGDGEKIIDVL